MRSHNAMRKPGRDLAALTAVAIVAAQSHVYGYIDPGTASMLLQGVIGGVAAMLVITRTYWFRALRGVRRALGRPADVTPATPAEHRPAERSTTQLPGA